ncbi:phosphotransferase family protein [Paenibacillus spongiae]|uniref:Aminoglycoside phosphotransferase family protein n=1 Tax=Paenibacillus spongiae TaxID=2909671 RepID=A0ABY5S6X4_9BACL|nr:aminoglycoside phosphotransferase family protein [Paenibacillus spongiae]UVI29414.1 aminoglycoside phosphotransferase family protein [Paenibacillus spongiae]
MLSTSSTLSDRAQSWVIDAVHPNARVLSIQRLLGGISSLVHSVTLEVEGEERAYVLRMFDSENWVKHMPDLAYHEAESLRRAAQNAIVPTPEIIAFDQTGDQCGTPAVLMSRLEGRVVLEPADTSQWLNGMAQALTRIHAVDVNDYPWTFYPYCDPSSLDTSSWSKFPDKWRIVADYVAGRQPAFTKRFIHRDYHPANILWNNSEVSGIVDWVNGCIGPAGIDVGHCRVNLAALHGVRTADGFLDAYRSLAGDSFTYDPYWDLVTLIDFGCWQPEVYGGWTALGVTGLTNEMMVERLDSYMLSLLDRISDL